MSEIMHSRRFAIHAPPKDAVVLCIDDDELVLEVTKAILKRNGYSVLTATSGLQALEIFRGNIIDLVLLDYEMPGMKGHEVAMEMRAFNPQVPVVLHSGAAEIPEITMQLTDAFISKGSETCILLATLADLITKNRAGSERNGVAHTIPAAPPAK